MSFLKNSSSFSLQNVIFLILFSILLASCSSGERLTAEERMEQRHQAHIERILAEDVSGIEERIPEMIGGQQAFFRILEYPNSARRNNIQGTVILGFTVNNLGIPEEIEVVRSVHSDLDRAAIAALEQMLFIPGVQRGERVRVQLTQPARFALSP